MIASVSPEVKDISFNCLLKSGGVWPKQQGGAPGILLAKEDHTLQKSDNG